MADAVLDRAGGPQPDDRADSGYAVSPAPAGPDGRPPRPGVPVWPGSVMTEAPARRREQPRPDGSGPGPGAPPPHRGRRARARPAGGQGAQPVGPGGLAVRGDLAGLPGPAGRGAVEEP